MKKIVNKNIRLTKKGFTLIELLAVLLILGVLAIITVPITIDVVKKSDRQAFISSVKNVIHMLSIENYVNANDIVYNINNGNVSPTIAINGKLNGDGYIKLDERNNIKVLINYKNYCVKKEFSDADVFVYDENCDSKPVEVINADKSGANIPILDYAMIAVKWNGTSWIKADKLNGGGVNQWYDYDALMWANAVNVNVDKVDKYQALPVGSLIDDKDIKAYFVWIPKYKYYLEEGISERAFTIELMKTVSKGDLARVHPAFTWQNEEVNGFWMGKFEAGNSVDDIVIKPNENTLKNTSLAKMYTAVMDWNKLKHTNDNESQISEVHLLKNIEWGAVAILTQSKYGLCKSDGCHPISKNSVFKTGAYDKNNMYPSAKSLNTSTTGNIYGVFDMAGGAWEYTMGTNKISSIGVSPAVPTQYYDFYAGDVGIVGDATNSDNTAGWYGAKALFISPSINWFVRGGDVNTPDAGIFWYSSDRINGGFRNGFRIAHTLKPHIK